MREADKSCADSRRKAEFQNGGNVDNDREIFFFAEKRGLAAWHGGGGAPCAPPVPAKKQGLDVRRGVSGAPMAYKKGAKAMSVLVYCLVAGILGCFLAMLIIVARDGNDKPIPDVDITPPLTRKELNMLRDLSNVGQKLGLTTLAKLPLNEVVQARAEGRRFKLRGRLSECVVPFMLTEEKTGNCVLAVVTAEFSDPLTVEVLDLARLPYLPISNYNLPGLEKAIRDKLGGTYLAAKGRRDAGPAGPAPFAAERKEEEERAE